MVHGPMVYVSQGQGLRKTQLASSPQLSVTRL